MGRSGNVEFQVHLEGDGVPRTMAREVREGLSRSPKRLPSKYFYDEHGSRLFERITELPEYYLTRAEVALLETRGADIARVSRLQDLVELGSGAATKTRLLIEAGLAEGTLRRYVPVEVSHDVVQRSARALAERYPELEVHAVVGDFDSHLGELPKGHRRLVALLGSTIGNYPEPDCIELLRKIGGLLDSKDWLLLGTDLVKDQEVLERAYNDAQGVTAEFNRNILNVINRHLAGDFDPLAFEHVAFYNAEHERIESYLRSTRAQRVRLAAIDFEVAFEEGELLWTEVSCKYTESSVRRIVRAAGLRLRHWMPDAAGAFALSLSRR
jgi:L-histidine N-alpha-methyltransferase